MHGGETNQRTSQALSVLALLFEWWETLLMYNLESGFQEGMWDLCQESGREEISETLKTLC